MTLWTVARQAPLPMGFSREEYWGGLPCLPPGDLLTQGLDFIETERTVVVARGWRGGKSGELLLNSHSISDWDDEKLLEMDISDGCTAM